MGSQGYRSAGPAGASGKHSVLFLGRGNGVRSQMAEGWLTKLGGEYFDASSAAAEASREDLHPLAVQVMAEAGVDITGQQPQPLERVATQEFDFVITVSNRARDTGLAIKADDEHIHWSFDDPTSLPEDEQRDAFRRVRDEIRTRVQLFIGAQTHARV